MTNLKNQLEDLIDQHGIQLVLERLATICFDKAEHLETNWQDRFDANLWISRGKAVDKVATRPIMLDK